MNVLLLNLSRAFLLRCPNCGSGGLFRRWIFIKTHCPRCGLWLERGPGFYTGAIATNLLVAEAVFLATFVAGIVFTWPNPPWDLLQWGGLVLMIVFPIVFFPFSKTIWLAVDLAVRPASRAELASVFGPVADEDA